MRRIITLAMALLMVLTSVLVFGACGGGEKANDENVLKVGLECAYQPFNWTQDTDANGAVAIEGSNQYANGYDVQIAKKIAEGMGKELVVVKLAWEGLLPAVQSGAIDMIIAGMSPTAERLESIDFSEAYYESNLVVVVRKDGEYAAAKSINDFEGATIVGQLGTFHETVIPQMAGVTQETSMKDFPTMIMALKSKTIDGYIAEKPGAIADCKLNDDLTYVDLVNNDTGFTVDAENVTIAVGVKKGSELTAKINEILGTIDQATRDKLMSDAIDQCEQ